MVLNDRWKIKQPSQLTKQVLVLLQCLVVILRWVRIYYLKIIVTLRH